MSVDYRVGDTREVIKTIADGSVDLVCSSPPFLALRSYIPQDHDSKHQEIGSERNPAEFIDMLLGLTAEWGRVLAPHGSIAIELGDTYSGGGGEVASREHRPERNGTGADGGARVVPIKDGAYWPRAKSLALIPQLYAVALAYGINPLTGQPSPAGRWLVRNVIVWHRPNPAVGALGDKYRPSTSYIVVATRSPKRWFDLTAVRTEQTEAGRSFQRTGKRLTLEGDRKCAEFGQNPAGAPPLDAWFDPYDGSHDTWTLTTQPSGLAHYAMWPAKLAERLILSMCPLAVCRVCGEPRRRVEGPAEYVPSATYRGGSMLNGSARVADGVNQWIGEDGASASLVRRAPTLGWTDCGCACRRCGGSGLTSRGQWFNTSAATGSPVPCRECHGEQHYRPGLTLDPFAGSGTTLAVADLHGRDAIGIDFDSRNKAIYPARFDEVKRALFGTPAPMPGQGDLFAEVPA